MLMERREVLPADGLSGADEGRAHVEAADSWMMQQEIRNPSRMADVFAPVVA
jgi:hypothetical protein